MDLKDKFLNDIPATFIYVGIVGFIILILFLILIFVIFFSIIYLIFLNLCKSGDSESWKNFLYNLVFNINVFILLFFFIAILIISS